MKNLQQIFCTPSCYWLRFAPQKLLANAQNVSHAHSQSLSQLVDNQVSDVLLHTMSGISDMLLQLIDVVHARFMHPLLRYTPDLEVD